MSPRLTALLLVSAVAWLAPATAGAQSAIISGIVHGADGEPINDATVVARTAPSDQRDRTTQTTTNESGRFGFIGLRAGRWIGAIDAYAEMLERVPQLTSLNLQIGHAYREKLDFERALAAYRAVPADSPAAREAAAEIEALQTENGASGR